MAWRHDIQTLNSYARLIWVCTHSPKRSALSNAREQGENTTFRSFCSVPVQNMMTVIADHSCRRLTMSRRRMLQLLPCAATSNGYTGTCLNAYPACLAFSAQQNAKRRLGTPPLQGIGQAAALSFCACLRMRRPMGGLSVALWERVYPRTPAKPVPPTESPSSRVNPLPQRPRKGKFQAKVSRTWAISCNTAVSPRSVQYSAIIRASASTL